MSDKARILPCKVIEHPAKAKIVPSKTLEAQVAAQARVTQPAAPIYRSRASSRIYQPLSAERVHATIFGKDQVVIPAADVAYIFGRDDEPETCTPSGHLAYDPREGPTIEIRYTDDDGTFESK